MSYRRPTLEEYQLAISGNYPIEHYDDYLYPPTQRTYRFERNMINENGIINHVPAPLTEITRLTNKGEITPDITLLQHIGSSDDAKPIKTR